MTLHHLFFPVLVLTCAAAVFAQDAAPPPASSPASLQPGQTQPPPPDKRVFGVLPNYRTANESAAYHSITVKQKFGIASKDSFDYPLVGLAAFIAGYGQLENSHPEFGQGWAGYGRRVGTSYADQAIGNMMTEAFFPSFLHEDPRYFRRGSGSVWSRTFYAATRVFVTRTDSGGRRFNFSEVLGNSAATAISNAYYTDSRDFDGNVEKLGSQIGIDAVSQVLKEFWPDIKHKLFHGPDPRTAAEPAP